MAVEIELIENEAATLTEVAPAVSVAMVLVVGLVDANFANTPSGWWEVANSNVGNLTFNNNIATVTAVATGGSGIRHVGGTYITGHKYLLQVDVKTDGTDIKCGGSLDSETLVTNCIITTVIISSTWTRLGGICNYTNGGHSGIRFAYISNTPLQVGETISFRNCILFDLTQMFGTTIADYIYSLEQNTVGAGVAWFKNLFPDDYYAYNAGELMSVNTSAHVMRNASNSIIGSYPLDSTLTLRGIPKLDEDNNLYYDGDTYESDGTVTRKYGVVDLGTLRWEYNSTRKCFQANLANEKNYKQNNVLNATCPIFTTKSPAYNTAIANADDKTIWFSLSQRVYCFKYSASGTDAAAFKTAMSGVYLVYELATPTTETADPYTDSQVMDAYGTEEFVDSRDVAIPAGHETTYIGETGEPISNITIELVAE